MWYIFLSQPKFLKGMEDTNLFFFPLKNVDQYLNVFGDWDLLVPAELAFLGSLIRQWQWLEVMNSKFIWIYNWTLLSIVTFSLTLNWLVTFSCSGRANIYTRMTYLWSQVNSSKPFHCSRQPLSQRLKPNHRRTKTCVILKCNIGTSLGLHIMHLLFWGLCFFPALIGPDVVNTSEKHIFSLFCVRGKNAVNSGKVLFHKLLRVWAK